MEDVATSGVVRLIPCGLDADKKVVEADIVIRGLPPEDNLFHISRGMPPEKCNDCIWELVEWLQKKFIELAEKEMKGK